MRITPGQQCWMAGASRKGGLGPSSLGFYIRGNPVHPGMMMVVMMNSTSEGSWAHRGWSWWPIWPWYWPWACCWWSYWPWCCPYDDVVDHVNAGVDDVKVRMQERGRVESSELERGNPGTSGLVVGQFGTGQFGTGQFDTGQFGTKIIKADNLPPR